MKRRVTTHPRAERDVARIYAWIKRRSVPGANAWYHAYRKAVERASEAPDQCAVAAESALVPLQVGPANWNNVNSLAKLELPADDRLLIATFHYYEPFQFTHQGASWAKGSDAWRGRKWTGAEEELKRLRTDFDKAAAWSKASGRPIFLGEFGAYSAADMDSRARWTAAVVREVESRGFSFAYWEFGSGFGAYDPAHKNWRRPLLQALVSEP